jgi:Spy/CpxP family protein refolding chaperone
MKTRALFVFVLIMTLGVCLSGYAQSDQQEPSQQQGPHGMGRGHGRPPSPDQQLAHLTQALNLTSDQQAKIKPILEDQSKQMEALRQDTSTSRQDRFAKMQEIMKNSHTQIREVLNSDQQQKFDTLMKNRMGGPHRAGPGGDQNPPTSQQ